MFQQFWKVTSTIVGFAWNLQKYQDELKDARKEIVEIQKIVHALALEIKHSRDLHDKDFDHFRETQNLEYQKHLLELDKRITDASRLLESNNKKSKK